MLYLLIPLVFLAIGLVSVWARNQREQEVSAGVEAFRAGMGAIAPQNQQQQNPQQQPPGSVDGSPDNWS